MLTVWLAIAWTYYKKYLKIQSPIIQKNLQKTYYNSLGGVYQIQSMRFFKQP